MSDIKKRIAYTSVPVPNHGSTKARQRYGSKDLNSIGSFGNCRKDSKTEDALLRHPSPPKDYEPVLGSMEMVKNNRRLKPSAKGESISVAPKTPPRVQLTTKRFGKARDILSASYNDKGKKRAVPLRRLDFQNKGLEYSQSDIRLSTLLKQSLIDNKSATIQLKDSRNNHPSLSQLSKTQDSRDLLSSTFNNTLSSQNKRNPFSKQLLVQKHEEEIKYKNRLMTEQYLTHNSTYLKSLTSQKETEEYYLKRMYESQ